MQNLSIQDDNGANIRESEGFKRAFPHLSLSPIQEQLAAVVLGGFIDSVSITYDQCCKVNRALNELRLEKYGISYVSCCAMSGKITTKCNETFVDWNVSIVLTNGIQAVKKVKIPMPLFEKLIA